jgi:putative peptidoglycan lipid II flippase
VSTEAHADHRPLAAAVRTVSGLTLLSRIAGLLRDLVTVRVFADSAVGSAFAAALAIPNTFRRLFGEGALSAAFIPEYTTLTRDDSALAQRFATLVVALLTLATGAITIALELVLAFLLTAADDAPDAALSLRLIMITLPYMPLVCAGAILGAMLQVHNRFAPHAAAPIILNLFIIVAATTHFVIDGATPARTAVYISIATVIAGAAQLAWCALALRRHIRWTRSFHATRDAARRLASRFLPALLGLGTLQLNSLIDTLIAMWPIWFGPAILGLAYPLDDASNSILFFSQRLYQFPLGVFGIAVATAVFPLLSRHAREPDHFLQTLRRGVRLSIFIALPATIGLALVSRDLVAVMYTGAGGFSADGAARATAVLVGYAFGVWAYSLNQILTRAFYALGDTRTPMRIAIAMVGLNLALNLALIWPFREAGLAWATATAATAQLAALAFILGRRLGVPILDPPTRSSVARIVPLSGAMGILVALSILVAPAPTTWSAHLAILGVAILVGMGAYTAGARALRLHELSWLVKLR